MNAIRPRSVTLLSWLFILSGLLGAGSLLWFQLTPSMFDRVPFELTVPTIALSWLSSLVYLVSGVCLLNGRNLGRHLLWLGLMPVFIVTVLFTRRWDASLLSLGVLVITIWPLFTPSVHRYFRRQQTENDLRVIRDRGSSNLTLWRKILGIFLFIVSGFLIYLVSFLAFLNVYGQYGILMEALFEYAVPWVFVHAGALFIYNAPSRYFVSGLTFLGGASFTVFLIWIVFNYPMPELDSSIDIKESFSGVVSGYLVTSLFLTLGVAQLAVHFFTSNRDGVKSEERS